MGRSEWRLQQWMRRMRHATTADSEEDDRCRRCGIWPDQRTGVSGNWLIHRLRLCPCRLKRISYQVEREGLAWNLEEQGAAVL